MDALEHLMSLGADCVGGSILLRHTELGRLRNGQLHLTEAGQEALKTVKVGDVEVLPVEKPAKGRKPKAVVEEVEVKPAPAVTLDEDFVPDVDVDVQLD